MSLLLDPSLLVGAGAAIERLEPDEEQARWPTHLVAAAGFATYPLWLRLGRLGRRD